MKVPRRLLGFFQRRRLEAEMKAEMEHHLEMQVERHRADGMDAEQARYAALRQFGNVASVQERAREARGWVWLEQSAKDFRFAVRSLAKAPGFTLAVVAALAVGIGATTAIVSFAWPIVFPKIPFAAPERMVVMTDPGISAPQAEAPYPFFSFPYRFASIREASSSFAALGAVRQEQANLVVAGDPAAAHLGWVTADYLALLGATTERGRLFLPEEYLDKNSEAVVLSWRFFEKRFGADPGIVGRDILLDGRNRRVVGVLAKQFAPPLQFAGAEIYLPETLSATPSSFPFRWVQVIGRLKPDVTIEQAQQDLAAFHWPEPPAMNDYLESVRPRLVPLTAYYGGNVTIYWVFFGAAGFLYAIACSNAASLMLAKTIARRRELGVRLAMGGSRGRIVRLLLAETLVVSGIAGAAGILIAHWGLWALTLQPGVRDMTAEHDMLNLPLLAVAIGMSLITSVLMVVVPALRISQVKVSDALKEGAGSLGDSRGLQRMRSGLVVVQAALAVALLAGAGLTLRSFWRLEQVSLGFDPADKLAVTAILPEGVAPEAYLDAAARFRDELARLPGVKAVTQAAILPLAHFASTWTFGIDGHPEFGDVKFSANRVSPEYFATLGLSIRDGRGFEGLHPPHPPVVVINQTAARRFFGAGSPVGRCLTINGEKLEIIGVASDVRERGRRAAVEPQLYCPFWQPPVPTGGFIELVRLDGAAPVALEAMVRRAAYAVEPRLVVAVERLAENSSRDTFNERRAMVVLQGLSALAIVLAATGLFAVVSYAVVQRQREFGVRMALGAAPADLLRLVLRRGLALAVTGIVLGLGVAWALTRFLQSVLFDTSPHDPAIYGAVTAGLLVVALTASWLPARRAAKVDPVIALRAE